MSEFFVDTSAIIKHYVVETGSAWVQSWADRAAGNIIIVSQLASVEFVSSLSRRLREGKMTVSDFIALRGAFLTDRDEFYIACALEAAHLFNTQPTFVYADTRLLAAASAEGLTTDDPNTHP